MFPIKWNQPPWRNIEVNNVYQVGPDVITQV